LPAVAACAAAGATRRAQWSVAMKLVEQIQRNLLSIISLVVAITALSYNTYRNELTEENRNIRNAGFEVLKELNQLQLLIDYAHYDRDVIRGNPITGWGHVMYLKDMSYLVSVELASEAEALAEVWGEEWQSLGSEEKSNARVTDAINALRSRVRSDIKALR
jgi:hypothetical protein